MTNKIGAALLIILISGMFIAPSLGISIKLGSGDGRGGTSSHVALHLDDSSMYNGNTIISSGEITKFSTMKGEGSNSLQDTISGNGYSISNNVQGSGFISTSASAQGSPDAGAANIKAAIAGKSGSMSSSSSSDQNEIMAAGGFDGEGHLSADLSLQGGTISTISGSADILGVNCLDKEGSEYLSSNEIAKTVNGLQLTSKGDIGEFGFAAANVRSSGSNEEKKVSNGEIVPGDYEDYDDPNAWVPAGYRWRSNPNIAFVVRDDAALRGEGLTATQAQNAILNAANTWDGATKQSLYKDSVTKSSTAVVNLNRPDGKNVQAWTSNGFSGESETALAFASTWYYTNRYVLGPDKTRYNQAVESDVSYNTAYSWTTDASVAKLAPEGAPISKNILDVQTVALHEMGHTIGLGDTYLHETYQYDLAQIMGFYNGVQRTLGSGDTTGVKKLYGI